MWWRAGESQSSSPTSDDGSRGMSSAPSAGGSGGNVRGHSYAEHQQLLQQSLRQHPQQQLSQHHLQRSEGAGSNSNLELSFENLLSPDQQQHEQRHPAAVVRRQRPQQPIQEFARVQQQPSEQNEHGRLSSNLGATGGPLHYNKFTVGSLANVECTSEYAQCSTSQSSTAPACSLSTSLRETATALSVNKDGRVFIQGDFAGPYVSSHQTTAALPGDDLAQARDRTRNLSTKGSAGHDDRELKVGGLAPMLPSVFVVGESRSRGQWSDGSHVTPFGGVFVETTAGAGAPGFQAPGRLPSVSRLLGNVRALGSTTSPAGLSCDDQHTRATWGGAVGGAVRTTPTDLALVGGSPPLQQQQRLASSQQQLQQRPSIASSSMGISQQRQQGYPANPTAAYMYSPGLPFIGERAPIIGDGGSGSGGVVDEGNARGVRQPLHSPSEPYPNRPLPVPSRVASPLIEATASTAAAAPAAAAVGMGSNSTKLGMGQHVAAAVGGGIGSYHLRQFEGCIVEGCREPLVATAAAAAATVIVGPSSGLETRRFCQRHIGLSTPHRHPSPSYQPSPMMMAAGQPLPPAPAFPPSDIKKQQRQQYHPPHRRGVFFSAPGTSHASGSYAVSRDEVKSKGSGGRGVGGMGTGARGGGRCEFLDCATQPRYATQGSTRPQFCGLHKLPGQVNVVSRCCKHEGCNKVPHFGNNQERPLYCGEHKLEGMVNVANRRCEDPDCQRQPTYGHKGDKRPRFCSTHKQPGMYDVIARRCEVPGCMTRAAFNFQGQKSVKYCAAHKQEGMENLKSKCCEVEGCKKYRVYGFDGEPAVRCASHKREGMVDVRSSRCEFQDCFRHPSFGYKWEKKRRFCGTHKLADMMDVRSRKQPQQRAGRGGAARESNPEASTASLPPLSASPSRRVGRGQRRSSVLSATPAIPSEAPAAPPGPSIGGESFLFGTGDILHSYPPPGGGPVTEPESGQGLWMHPVGQGPHYGSQFPGNSSGSGGGGASQLTSVPRGSDRQRFGNPEDMAGK